MTRGIANIRTEYKLKSLSEQDVLPNPVDQFSVWWDEAANSKVDEINAMALATATTDGIPSSRIVLLKEFTHEGFVFFTNYNSAKGKELELNPFAALVFFWKELERQIRIEGTVSKTSEADSEAYFASRPLISQLGAWASPQSTPISGRHVIEANAEQYKAQFKGNIPRPQHWGGYIVKPVRIEFWQGRPARLHDRINYTRQNESWKIERLAP